MFRNFITTQCGADKSKVQNFPIYRPTNDAPVLYGRLVVNKYRRFPWVRANGIPCGLTSCLEVVVTCPKCGDDHAHAWAGWPGFDVSDLGQLLFEEIPHPCSNSCFPEWGDEFGGGWWVGIDRDPASRESARRTLARWSGKPPVVCDRPRGRNRIGGAR